MKKTICFLVICALFSSCTSGKQKTDNNEQQTAETTTAESTDISYTQCRLAYLIEGELYFYNFEYNEKVKFVEESEPIFNFTFDTEGETLYYSVERDGLLWLKLADISEQTITPKWLVDWGLIKNEFDSEPDVGPSPLYYYKGELILRYNFNWDYYDFDKMAIYSIVNKKITLKEFDWFYLSLDFMSKVYGELSLEKSEQYFQTVDEQLYYSNNNTKVGLTNQLNLDVIKKQWSEEYWNQTEFCDFTFSPDKTKILFAALIYQGELTSGPYCISNIDGNKQMVLEQTRTDLREKPIWLKNNRIAFIGDVNKLFVADNDKNSILQIAENVSLYTAR